MRLEPRPSYLGTLLLRRLGSSTRAAGLVVGSARTDRVWCRPTHYTRIVERSAALNDGKTLDTKAWKRSRFRLKLSSWSTDYCGHGNEASPGRQGEDGAARRAFIRSDASTSRLVASTTVTQRPALGTVGGDHTCGQRPLLRLGCSVRAAVAAGHCGRAGKPSAAGTGSYASSFPEPLSYRQRLAPSGVNSSPIKDARCGVAIKGTSPFNAVPASARPDRGTSICRSTTTYWHCGTVPGQEQRP